MVTEEVSDMVHTKRDEDEDVFTRQLNTVYEGGTENLFDTFTKKVEFALKVDLFEL